MREMNVASDEEWIWDGEDWKSGFDEHFSYSPSNRSEDPVIGGVISSIVLVQRKRYGPVQRMGLWIIVLLLLPLILSGDEHCL